MDSGKRVEICWRMRSLQESTRILECGIYRKATPGFEVCVGYSDEDDLLMSQGTADIGSAREVAETLRQAMFALGGFKELEESDGPEGA
jgi:hypothetical protein